MEPTTIILGISGFTLLTALTVKVMRRGEVETEAMANARDRAEKRSAERALIGDVQDDFAFNNTSMYGGFQDNHDVTEPNEEQNRIIELLMEGNVLPAIHRPVFPGGVGHLEAGGMSIAQAVYVEENLVAKAGKIEFLAPDYQWPEAYKR
jgi:hypothetical protein